MRAAPPARLLHRLPSLNRSYCLIKNPAIADEVMPIMFAWGKVLLNLFGTVFRHFSKRIATASITFKKEGQETKHHYSSQRRPSGKGKPFTKLVHAARLDVVWQIVKFEVYKRNKNPALRRGDCSVGRWIAIISSTRMKFVPGNSLSEACPCTAARHMHCLYRNDSSSTTLHHECHYQAGIQA